MTISVEISIKAANLDDAREAVEGIALDIGQDRFGASCSKAEQERHGGTVFVTDDKPHVSALEKERRILWP